MWGSNDEANEVDGVDEVSEVVEPIEDEPIKVADVMSIKAEGYIAIKGVHRRGGRRFRPGDHIPVGAYPPETIKLFLQRAAIKKIGE